MESLIHGNSPQHAKPKQSPEDPYGRIAFLLHRSHRSIDLLPPIPELLASLSTLAKGTRSKVLIPISDQPLEYAFVRQGDTVLVSYYDTSSHPNVRWLNRPVYLRELLDACGNACLESTRQELDRTSFKKKTYSESEQTDRALAARLGRQALNIELTPAPMIEFQPRSTLKEDVPQEAIALAFGFEVQIPHNAEPAHLGSSVSDLHALLFEGQLWAFLRGRRLTLTQGPVMLGVKRLLSATRALLEAWESGRMLNVRLRGDNFGIGLRLDEREELSLTLGTPQSGAVTAVGMGVTDVATPVLKLASDLLRGLVSADRSQNRNLRVRQLREEVNTLRKLVRLQRRPEGFINRNSEGLRAVAHVELESDRRESQSPPASLRYAERWRMTVDGLDANAMFFCGDRLVVTSPKHTLAVSRDDGEVLWIREARGHTALMARTILVRIAKDGEVELCRVDDGEAYARTSILPPAVDEVAGVVAGGRSIPPVAILVEGHHRLVAVDLRTAELRWRFAPQGTGPIRFTRAGRLLLAVRGDRSVHALDVVSGEVIWRFSARVRFCIRPCVTQDRVFVVSGDSSSQSVRVFGLDLYSGQELWSTSIEGAPLAPPIHTAARAAIFAMNMKGDGPRLVSLDENGIDRWSTPDPGMHRGAAPLCVDDQLLLNTTEGYVHSLHLETGQTRWSRQLNQSKTQDVPRRLEPILRGGALFVPSEHVHVLRVCDGTSIGSQLPCELIPDAIRVDERNWVYVAEESGYVAAYAPVPHLTLVRGGST